MPAQTESLSPRTGEEPAPTSNPAESLFTTLTPTFLPLNHLGSNCYAFLPESTEIPLFQMLRAAFSSLCVQRTVFLYRACRAKRMHSSTRRLPMPSPRAEGSTSRSRSLAISLDLLTRKTDPTRSPSFSAIQQRSRCGL